MTTIDAAAIRALNDRLRVDHDFSLGKWVTTRGVADKGLLFVQRVSRAVRQFNDFNKGNDPHGERDCATLQIDNEYVIWKIDYFADAQLERGSEDPSDPNASYRVLTIMLSGEY